MALLFGAPALAIALHMCGVPLWSLSQSQTWSSTSGSVTSSAYQMHWPLLVLGAIAVIGVVLLLLRRGEKPNAGHIV